MVGIISIRLSRMIRERKDGDISSNIYVPLMQFISGESSLERTYDVIRRYPRYNICMELERYGIMLAAAILVIFLIGRNIVLIELDFLFSSISIHITEIIFKSIFS